MDFGIGIATSSDSWKLAQRAEALGFTHAWFFDTQMITADCFVAMAAAAMKTSRIRLGTGVLVPSNRIAAVTANAFATLNGLAPGRIDFGVGTGFSARRAMGMGAMKLADMEEYIRVVYALIAATVGTLLRAIAERVGIIGRLIVGLVGVGWTVATALVVPILAAENVGPVEAIGRSVDLIKKSWGENIIGNAGIGIVFGAVVCLVALTGGVLVLAAFGNREWALGLVLAFDGRGHDLVEGGLHAVELKFAHEVEELSSFHQMVLLRLS
jgi:hypothetical protein